MQTIGKALKWIVGIFFLLIVIAIFSNSGDKAKKVGTSDGSANSATTTQQVYAVGDQIEVKNRVLTVESVQRDYSTGNEFDKPEDGKEYVLVTVKLENKGSDKISFNIFDFKIKDSSGTMRDSGFITVKNSLSSGELAPSGKVEGNIPFEVTKGDTGLELVFEPSFWSDAVYVRL